MTNGWRMIARTAGGPEVIEREEAVFGHPSLGEALVRHTAIGVNFIDTYHRSGLYPRPFPIFLGSEAVGVIDAVGGGVAGLKPGDRVGYAVRTPGSYASHATVDAAALVALPDEIDDATVAAALLKGFTAWALVERCAKLRPGQSVLVHAAAGGVGSILVQWVKAVGGIVIAHAGTPAKAERATALGADHALSCSFDLLAEEVRRLTDGRGVDVVLDGVGAASWTASLAAVARRGLIASYGNASGPVPPVRLLDLTAAGSVFVTRPTMFDYVVTPEERVQAADRLFTLLRQQAVKIEIGQRFALADAAEAHRALESRSTTGSTVLIP